MRKQLLLLIGILFSSLACFSNVTIPVENSENDNQHFYEQTGGILNFVCSVTRYASYSLDGTDCNGLPWSVTTTENCSATAATCETASSQAYTCAWVKLFLEHGIMLCLCTIAHNNLHNKQNIF